MKLNSNPGLSISVSTVRLDVINEFIRKNIYYLLFILLSAVSIISFLIYYFNGFGLSYNDARSHLDISRRVVENLKPGLAQIGSVWLPLPHLLMLPTIWNDFMWHTGLSGAIQSMVSYVFSGLIIFHFLRRLGVGLFGGIVGVCVFAFNTNILYLQSTAMTELLLMATLTFAVYELVMWFKDDTLLRLIKSAFFIMLATLIRYEGWFLCASATALIGLYALKKKGWSTMEGTVILFCTLSGLGAVLWFLWNLVIFKDPLYFALGPYSARTQQLQIEQAGQLLTKGNMLFSLKTYAYALIYNTNVLLLVLSIVGALLFWIDKKISTAVRFASLSLISPLVFNVLALYFGHSVLFVQGLAGNSWFNVRYGIMMLPAMAIFVGYLISRVGAFKYALTGLLLFVSLIALANNDAVTLDDARFGSSGKNVVEVSGWLRNNAKDQAGFVLISVASHDAIIFSSGMPMKRFIHEGTGLYWENAIGKPEKWARWIIMRTNDPNDLTFRSLKTSKYENKYTLVDSFPFADIYELKPEYVRTVITKPVIGPQK